MTAVLRTPRAEECPALTSLCLRSKAFWGYDDAFMAACEAELTVSPEDLTTRDIIVLDEDGTLVGTAQIAVEDGVADLLKFFVEPDAIGKGCGARLFAWAVARAKAAGATRINIEADPQAAPFYEHMGAKIVGKAPSESIPGRFLPVLRYDLDAQEIA